MSDFRFTPISKISNLYRQRNAILPGYRIDDRPQEIPEQAVRNGEYSIRDYGFRFDAHYCKEKDTWIVSSLFSEKDFTEIIDWNLLPNLSEKEWNHINNVPYKALNKKWQDYRAAHNLITEARIARRKNKILFSK